MPGRTSLELNETPPVQNSVDLEKETNLTDVDYQWTLLEAGDCIFIPSHYMHQVGISNLD